MHQLITSTLKVGAKTAFVLLTLLATKGSAQIDHGTQNTSEYISGEAIQQDLTTLRQWILEMHPDPFAHCSILEFESTYKNACDMYLGGGSTWAAAQAVSKFCSVLHDSHTGISLNALGNYIAERHGRLSLEITTIDNRAYVIRDTQGELVPGTEIFHIAGRSARSILGSAIPLVAMEGDAQIARLRLADQFWNNLVPMFANTHGTDSVEVFIPDSLGGRKWLHIQQESPATSKSKQVPITWEWMPMENGQMLAILHIRAFQSKNTRSFERQLKKGFKAVHDYNTSEQLRGLILDLRNNTGGNVALMELLLPFIADQPVFLPHAVDIRQSAYTALAHRRDWSGLGILQRNREMSVFRKALKHTPIDTLVQIPFDQPALPHPRLLYDGPMAMLMNGLTASASVSLASWFVQSSRGKTYGEPPMGSVSGTFGNPQKRILPQTGITVNIATARYYTGRPSSWESHPLLPDHTVHWTPQDLFFHRDPVLEAAVSSFRHPLDVNTSSRSLEPDDPWWSALKNRIQEAGVFHDPFSWSTFEVSAMKILEMTHPTVIYHQEALSKLEELSDQDQSALQQMHRAAISTAVESRNASILELIPIESRTEVAAMIHPSRPEVLHFGMHNRMQCIICTPAN